MDRCHGRKFQPVHLEGAEEIDDQKYKTSVENHFPPESNVPRQMPPDKSLQKKALEKMPPDKFPWKKPPEQMLVRLYSNV